MHHSKRRVQNFDVLLTPPQALRADLRACWVILTGAAALFLTMICGLLAYYQTGLLPEGTLWRGGLFCGVLLFLTMLLFLFGFRAFAHLFRAMAVLLSIICLLSASYFISLRGNELRNVGVAFILLTTLPLIAFYTTTFTWTVRGYLLRRRLRRERM